MPASPAATEKALPSPVSRLQSQSPPRTRPSLAACRRVTSRVAEDFGVTLAELVAPSRGSPRAALARQVAMYLCHIGFALSFEAVGRLFARDRTTVAHACRVVEDRRDDRWFDRRLALLERACGFTLCGEREERGR
jgi:chromosomal replication initiation ATPase DnaA